MGVIQIPDEEYNVKFDYDWLKELAEKADELGKAERREQFKKAVKNIAEDSRLIYEAYVEAGFSDDQAFEVALAFIEGGFQ